MEASPTLPTTEVAKLFPKDSVTGNFQSKDFQFKERSRIEEATTQERTHKKTAIHSSRSRSKAGQKGENISNLRTASRKSKNRRHKNNFEAGSTTPQRQRARNRHNQSEKRYRERLNQHFSRLLDALPKHVQNGCAKVVAADANESSNLKGSGVDEDRRFSKGEVLDMATQYINMLEQVNETLNVERDSLLRRMEKEPMDSK